MKPSTKRLLRKYQSVIGLLLFTIVISFLSDRFLTIANLSNVLRQTSVNAIIAAGMTFVILTGGIDLSVGSTFAFTGAIAAYLVGNGTPAIVALMAALAVGTLIGTANGLFISKGKLQPFIVTLATMTLLRGATLVFTDGRPISTGFEGNAEAFLEIGAGSLLGIPNPIIIMTIVFAAGYYLLAHTTLGRYVYAMGGNEEATKLSGVNTHRTKLFVYGISGFFAALAGVIITARLASAQPTAGTGYELDAIAAVVLGGTSLAGGVGHIGGTIIGALIIGILSNALNLLDVSSYYQQLAKGLVILIAVLLDQKEK
jgi:ribose transport system permease protein